MKTNLKNDFANNSQNDRNNDRNIVSNDGLSFRLSALQYYYYMSRVVECNGKDDRDNALFEARSRSF